MSKKAKKKKIFPYRRTWNVSPITKVKRSKKLYNRQLTKKQVKEILTMEDF